MVIMQPPQTHNVHNIRSLRSRPPSGPAGLPPFLAQNRPSNKARVGLPPWVRVRLVAGIPGLVSQPQLSMQVPWRQEVRSDQLGDWRTTLTGAVHTDDVGQLVGVQCEQGGPAARLSPCRSLSSQQSNPFVRHQTSCPPVGWPGRGG
jgi:hypothetical protein